MTENELLHLCDRKNSYTGKSIWIYWPAELYSFGKYIREYGYFPKFLPLTIYCDHSGPSYSDLPYKHELETRAPVFLTHSKVKANNYSRITGKKSFTMLSPAIFYRRTNKIIQDINTTGTVVFPSHSTPSWESIFDIEKYCRKLKKLPLEFQPISVCLHMHDIAQGEYKIYQNEGFEVITAGNSSDYRFIERLYAILKRAKFVSSNYIGTIGLFCVEMGVPFFVYGNLPKVTNISDTNYKVGKVIKMGHKEAYYHSKLELSADFKVPKVERELKESIEEFLGVKDGISRIRMAFVLWYALFNWILTFKWVFWLKENRELLKERFNRYFIRK